MDCHLAPVQVGGVEWSEWVYSLEGEEEYMYLHAGMCPHWSVVVGTTPRQK